MTLGQTAFEAYIKASGDISPYNYESFENSRRAAWEAVADAILGEYPDVEASPEEELPTLYYKINKGGDEKFRWILRNGNGDFICDSGAFDTEASAMAAILMLDESRLQPGMSAPKE